MVSPKAMEVKKMLPQIAFNENAYLKSMNE